MAAKFPATVMDALRPGSPQIFNFVELQVSPPIYISDYIGPKEIDGKMFIPGVLKDTTAPPKTQGINQDIQSITVAEALNAFTTTDFLTALGNYHGATAIITTYIVGTSGELLTQPSEVLTRGEGFILKAYRSKGAKEVVLEVSNSYAQLDQIRELRTTRGSLERLDPDETTFNQAEAVNDNVALEWGT